MSTATPARIRVFWQPGCTSCLRVKEFLSKQGIAYESVDVHNDPQGLDDLRALGARSVPIVALGGRFTLAQNIRDVVKFLDLKTKVMAPLPPAELVGRLDRILRAAIRYAQQFSATQLKETFRNRNRTVAGLIFHVFRVSQMGLEAARQIELRFESFDDLPPSEWGTEQLVAFGESIRGALAQWWASEADRDLRYTAPTYYGTQVMHDVLERTTWHAAQHTRQLVLILESYGIVPDGPLSADDLAGLPVPDEVWDR